MEFIKFIKKVIRIFSIVTIIILINYKKVSDISHNYIVEKYIEKDFVDYIEINDYKLIIKSGDEKEVLDSNYVFYMNNSSEDNIFLAGHNNHIVFNRIYNLEIKDTIKLNYNNKLYTYEVYNTKYISVKSVDIFKKENFSRLTLITCTKNNQKRYIVECKIKE